MAKVKRSVRQAGVLPVEPVDEEATASRPGFSPASFLKESKQVPWKLAAAKRHTNQLKKEFLRFDRTSAEGAHEVGTQLIVAFAAKVHLAFGLKSFPAWLRAKTAIPRTSAYKYMLVARFASAGDTRLGIETCHRGARLCLLTGADSISELRKVDLTLPDGRKVRFPQPSAVLDAAILVLGGDPDSGGGEETGPAQAESKRLVTRIIDEECEHTPELGRYFKVTVHKGQVSVRLESTPVAAVGEVAKLFTRVARRLGR